MTTTPRRPELGTEQKRAEPALCARKVTVDRAYGVADEGADWLRADG
jgi:hypothetical protein